MILGITPARGGSRGIPKKNIRQICGKPLLTWTIEAAKESKLLDDYVISTEDEEIAKIALKHGVKVINRPEKLADDETATIDVIRHAIEQNHCDVVVVLQVTSPIRKPGLIDECISEFIENKYDSLATGLMCRCKEYGKNSLRRQDIDGFFYDDGNVYVIKADLIRGGERFGERIGRKIISRWENIDIDDDFDFWTAEKILERWKR